MIENEREELEDGEKTRLQGEKMGGDGWSMEGKREMQKGMVETMIEEE